MFQRRHPVAVRQTGGRARRQQQFDDLLVRPAAVAQDHGLQQGGPAEPVDVVGVDVRDAEQLPYVTDVAALARRDQRDAVEPVTELQIGTGRQQDFAAIRSAAQGRTTLSPPVASRVMARMRSPLPTLTDRERDILGQLSQGLGNRDIARALFISEATVKTHLGRIYDKLGVDTRAGAVSVAKEQRLLP